MLCVYTYVHTLLFLSDRLQCQALNGQANESGHYADNTKDDSEQDAKQITTDCWTPQNMEKNMNTHELQTKRRGVEASQTKQCNHNVTKEGRIWQYAIVN